MRIYKVFIFTFLLSLAFASNQGKKTFDKFLWITADSMKDKESINEALYFAFDHDFDKVFVQCRFRGDAFYSSKLVPKNPSIQDRSFDPLDYAISIGHQLGLEVHAWMNTYILWTKSGKKKSAPNNLSHIYHTNKEWTESNIYGKSDSDIDLDQVQSLNWGGVYLSPNHPEVNNYLSLVFKEIIDNYNIDGLHLDYIRFQSDIYGFNKEGIKVFKDRYGFDPLDIERNIISTVYGWEQSEIDSMKTLWNNFKIENINNLLINVKNIIENSENKDIDFSAAVKPDYYLAKKKWSQDWMDWLDLELLDFVVLMNYASDNLKFIDPILQILTKDNANVDNIVMGISTYNQSANQVSDKLCTSYKSRFKGISLFSSNSIEDNQKDDLFWFNPILEFFYDKCEKRY